MTPRPAVMTFGAAGRLDPAIHPDTARTIDVPLKVSTTFAKGTVLGEVTTGGRYAAYASGNVDGSQTPKVILAYDCVTDAAGNIAAEGEFGQTRAVAPAYCQGIFACEALTGLDANAVTKLGANLLQGTVSTGLVRL